MIKVLRRREVEDNYINRMYYPNNAGEELDISFMDGCVATYVVINGSWTPYDCIRDCGDHYIFAQHSWYTRIDKNTLAVTEYVEDK